MTKTSFSGPVESIVGGFVAENGGSFITDGGDFKAINGGRFLSDGIGFIETITDPSGVTREVSGVPLNGAALTGENAGIVGTARAYSTILKRSAPTFEAVTISSIYIEVGDLSLGITTTPDLFPIGRESAGEVYPAYILQLLTGAGTQIGQLIGASMTCMVPTGGFDPYNSVGLAISTSGEGTQNQALPGPIALIPAQFWTLNETIYINVGSLANNEYLYLMQAASPLAGQFYSGLFRLDFYSIDA